MTDQAKLLTATLPVRGQPSSRKATASQGSQRTSSREFENA